MSATGIATTASLAAAAAVQRRTGGPWWNGRGSRPGQEPEVFKNGDAVAVWSWSMQRWFHDGIAETVDADGTVHVLFANATLRKDIPAGYVSELLQRVDHSKVPRVQVPVECVRIDQSKCATVERDEDVQTNDKCGDIGAATQPDCDDSGSSTAVVKRSDVDNGSQLEDFSADETPCRGQEPLEDVVSFINDVVADDSADAVPMPEDGARLFLRDRATGLYLGIVGPTDAEACVVTTELPASLLICHHRKSAKGTPKLQLEHEGLPVSGGFLSFRMAWWLSAAEAAGHNASDIRIQCSRRSGSLLAGAEKADADLCWSPDGSLRHRGSKRWLYVDESAPEKVLLDKDKKSYWEVLAAER